METNNIIALIIAIFGSGGIATLVTAWAAKKKNQAEAGATNVKSILEIDSRLNERITRLEERVGILEKENFELKQKELQLKHENQKYIEENDELKKENEELRTKNKLLNEENIKLRGIIIGGKRET